MKIVYFATYYSGYLDFFYEKNPSLQGSTYDTQLRALYDDFFGNFATYTVNANLLGHDAHLIIANCRPLQEAWAKENNVNFNEVDWQFSIPLEQVKRIRPDVFYIGSMFQYYGQFLEEIRKYCSKIFGWISCPIPEGKNPIQLDLVLSSAPHYVEMFRGMGLNSEVLPAAFDSTILSKKDFTFEPTIPLTFVGGLSGAHSKRVDAVKKMIANTPMELYGYGIKNFREGNLLTKLVHKFFGNEIQRRYSGEAWGLEMYQVLRSSKVTFNSHIDMAKGSAINMRMYEATGVGTLLLTDGRKSEGNMFEENEVVFYDSIEDAIEKAHYYLNHEEERRKIALAGQRRTLKDYNALDNSKQMLVYFDEYLAGK